MRLFINRQLAHERHGTRAKCIRLCAAAGLQEPYRFYLPLLDIGETDLTMRNEKGEDMGTSSFQMPVRELFARAIVEVFGKEQAVAEIVRKHQRAADQVVPLKAWLRKRASAK